MQPNNFTNKSQEAIQNAAQIAFKNSQPQVEPPHLFLAFLEDNNGVVVSIFNKLNINLDQLRAELQRQINSLPKDASLHQAATGQIILGQFTAQIFNVAGAEAKKMGDEFISVEHLLLAYLTGRNPISEYL